MVGLGGVIRCIDDILSARCERSARERAVCEAFDVRECVEKVLR